MDGIYILFFRRTYFVCETPEVRTRFDKRTEKTYNRLRFFTKTSLIFNEFYFLFYDPVTKKKKVPINICDFLTARSLAYWICDDGQYVKKNGITQGIVLCTESALRF